MSGRSFFPYDPFVPADDTLPFDVACTACGYNLRGTSPTGMCPECGRPTLDSLEVHVRRGSLFQHDVQSFVRRTPVFLRHVRSASRAALIANVLALLAAFVPLSLADGYPVLRYPPLLFLFIAFALTTVSLWHTAAAIGKGLWSLLLRFTCIAPVAVLAARTLISDPRVFTMGVTPGHYGAIFGLQGLCALTACAAVLRLAYMHWWLRLERRNWIAWPLLAIAVPLFFALISPGNFPGRAVRTAPAITLAAAPEFNPLITPFELPLPTGAWPGLTREVLSTWPHPYWSRAEWLALTMTAALLGQLWILDRKSVV